MFGIGRIRVHARLFVTHVLRMQSKYIISGSSSWNLCNQSSPNKLDTHMLTTQIIITVVAVVTVVITTRHLPDEHDHDMPVCSHEYCVPIS